MNKIMLISVKPEFAEKILNGEKSIELRKITPNISPGDIVIIYSTMPVKAVVGFCKVEKIFKLSPVEMWRKHNNKLGIDKKRYKAYFEKTLSAVGISLCSIYALENIISLKTIKEQLPAFNPPQTFRYFDVNAMKKVFSLCGVNLSLIYFSREHKEGLKRNKINTLSKVD